MEFKPMKKKAYEKWIGAFGWQLVRAGSDDYKLLNAAGKTMKPFIKVTHPGPEMVIPKHVKDTEKLLKQEGLI